MQAYQNGDDRAFNILFERHSSRVYGFLMNQLKNRAAADDVFQLTFLKLHQARRHYDPSFPFAPWLFTVCKSVLSDHWRKQKTIREDSNDIALENAPENVPDQPSNGSLATNESALDVAGMNTLSARERSVIDLRYRDDLKFEEIALRLKTSPSNVRQIVSRALRSLRLINVTRKDDV